MESIRDSRSVESEGRGAESHLEVIEHAMSGGRGSEERVVSAHGTQAGSEPIVERPERGGGGVADGVQVGRPGRIERARHGHARSHNGRRRPAANSVRRGSTERGKTRTGPTRIPSLEMSGIPRLAADEGAPYLSDAASVEAGIGRPHTWAGSCGFGGVWEAAEPPLVTVLPRRRPHLPGLAPPISPSPPSFPHSPRRHPRSMPSRRQCSRTNGGMAGVSRALWVLGHPWTSPFGPCHEAVRSTPALCPCQPSDPNMNPMSVPGLTRRDAQARIARGPRSHRLPACQLVPSSQRSRTAGRAADPATPVQGG